MEYSRMNIAELSALLQKREVSARELAADALKAIAETDGAIGAYLTACHLLHRRHHSQQCGIGIHTV